jgi:hypothetical protein
MVTADTIALLLFSSVASIFTLLAEVAVAGMSIKQWFWIRVIFNPLRFAGARFLGMLTDSLRRSILGKSHNPFLKVVADTLALWLYNLPLYIASGIIMGATRRQITISSSMQFLDTLCTGWLYGIILDRVRAYFKTRSK